MFLLHRVFSGSGYAAAFGGSNNTQNRPIAPISAYPPVRHSAIETRAPSGDPAPHQLDQIRFQRWPHVNEVLEYPLEDSYQAKVIEGFKWAE
jgi:hypothetical protein